MSTPELLAKIFIPTIIMHLQDATFYDLFLAEFPETNTLLSRYDRKDVAWRLEFSNALSSNTPRYLTWFENFIKTDHRCDEVIDAYAKWFDGKLLKTKKHAIDPALPAISEPTSGKQFYNPAMTTKGPLLWKKLHKYAAHWNQDIEEARRFLNRFLGEIGCGPCQKHWRILSTQTPADLSSREAFFTWTVEMHNKVNDRIERPRYALEQAKKDYDFDFIGFFDRVVVLVSSEQREAFFKTGLIRGEHWPLVQPSLVKTMNSTRLPAPTAWKSGVKNYAHVASHKHVLEEAINDGVDRLLVIEDKEGLSRDFSEQLRTALSNVPSDWDQLLFTPTSDSYAVRGDKKKEFYKKLCDSDAPFHKILHAGSGNAVLGKELFISPTQK